MYRALWRVIPGNALVKLLVFLNLAAATVLVMFRWVYPWLMEVLHIGESAVG
ncbi:MAG: hypothetical protein SOS98_01865 [Varibaculum sp.]|nr:hypothetical protein [Varibaculum sp.]